MAKDASSPNSARTKCSTGSNSATVSYGGERGQYGSAILREDGGPQVGVASGHAGRITKAGRRQAVQVVRQGVGQGRRGQVRQVAGHGQGVVVVLRAEQQHARPDLLPERPNALDGLRIGARRRRQHDEAAFKQVGAGVFGAAFLVGLALGTATHRPLATAGAVCGAVAGVLVAQTHEPFAAFATFALITLVGLVTDSVRETVVLLLGR